MSSAADQAFLSGVIEGFYGRPWPADVRLAYARYLRYLGLNTYLYCPKSDPFLRRRWAQPWPEQDYRTLSQLSAAMKAEGIFFGVGLSPFALYQNYRPADKTLLRSKVEAITELEAPVLAVLFDDMPGDMAGLAERQLEIVADIADWAPQCRLLICPTYYSFDPVLEKVFGTMPERYWQTLGAQLPSNVDVMWTGNKVCSESITADDIQDINRLLQRPVMLWDNYPVNDGAIRSKRLYTAPLADREGLQGLLAGHLCNPMNQALLSLPALAGLAQLYGDQNLEPAWLHRVLGEPVCDLLRERGPQLQADGLEGLSTAERETLADELARDENTAAQELAGWLRGEYTFDPACLTD